jgi:hypothetical protein
MRAMFSKVSEVTHAGCYLINTESNHLVVHVRALSVLQAILCLFDRRVAACIVRESEEIPLHLLRELLAVSISYSASGSESRRASKAWCSSFAEADGIVLLDWCGCSVCLCDLIRFETFGS